MNVRLFVVRFYIMDDACRFTEHSVSICDLKRVYTR